MGRRDDAHVGLDRRAPADRRVLALLQHAQQPRLRLERHVADLVEEQRAALGLLEAALRARLGAGEGALLVAEQLALDQFARDRRHVDRHERALPALAEVVQHARDQLLAGAALAVDHHGQVGLRQAGEDAIDLLHRRRAADERQLLAFDLLRRPLRRAPGLGQRAADDGDHLVEVERLGQVLVGALLGRRQRRHQRVLRAHDDDRQIGADLLDARDEIEGVLVRHDDVGDDDIALALADPAPQRGGVAGGARRVAGARQRLVEHGADRGVVVGDEDRAAGHSLPRARA